LGLVANPAFLHVLEILSDLKLELDGKRHHNPRLDMEPSDFQLELSGFEEDPRDTNRNKNISSQREFLFTALCRLKGVLDIFHDLSISFHDTRSYFPISVICKSSRGKAFSSFLALHIVTMVLCLPFLFSCLFRLNSQLKDPQLKKLIC